MSKRESSTANLRAAGIIPERLDPTSDTVTLTIKAPRALIDRVDAVATNRSEWIRDAIERALETDHRKAATLADLFLAAEV